MYSAFTGINTAFFDHDVNWGNLWGTNDIGPDGISANSDGGVDLQTDSRVTFDTGVSQTLGGYVHIKIDCGTSRSQLIPGNAGMARLKDGNYYEQYDTFTEETRYLIDLPRPRVIDELRFDDKFKDAEHRIWKELRDEII